jgi:hypothetical protein
MAREQIRVFKVLEIDYYPRESHLVTLRDPWSFPVLFHPACNSLVRQHMEDLAQKVNSTRPTSDFLTNNAISRLWLCVFRLESTP